MNTIEEFKEEYTAIEGYTLYVYKSNQSGNFVGIVFKKKEVSSRFSKDKEYTGGSEKVISEKDFEKYLNELKPYIKKREKVAQEGGKMLPETTT